MKFKLDDIDKKQPYKVPINYFEDLPLKIQTSVHKKKNSHVILSSWKLALAASLVIILSYFIISEQRTTSAETLLADIPETELIAYLDHMDLDLEDLTSTFQAASIEFEFQNIDGLNELDMNEEEIDDLLLLYDINDDYL